MSTKNADTIEDLKETSEFFFREAQTMKNKAAGIKTSNADHQKAITDLNDNVNKMDRQYKLEPLFVWGT